ncbi:MAG: matrixin family metalloprotease [Candidatus Pacebacteria bacterium]|nr:matrixin family metalloprotease [Candidatus Paceibacterota bacterium]
MKQLRYIIPTAIIIASGIYIYHIIPVLFTAPCSKPIYYSIGQFDSRFNIDKDTFLMNVGQAASVWNNAINKPILAYRTGSNKSDTDLIINLMYDDRQKITTQLDTISTTVDGQKASYDNLKIRYENLTRQYTADKSALDAEISTYSQALASYNAEVNNWNNKGGAPRDQITSLQAKKTTLDAMAAQLRADQNAFNLLVNNLNSLSSELNRAAEALNLNVKSYNTIGTGISEQFSEGEYILDETGPHINIYQYSTKNQLIRVLEHELGHSLGLDHVNDSHAIMYYLNKDTNETLTTSDIAELKSVCNIK